MGSSPQIIFPVQVAKHGSLNMTSKKIPEVWRKRSLLHFQRLLIESKHSRNSLSNSYLSLLVRINVLRRNFNVNSKGPSPSVNFESVNVLSSVSLVSWLQGCFAPLIQQDVRERTPDHGSSATRRRPQHRMNEFTCLV